LQRRSRRFQPAFLGTEESGRKPGTGTIGLLFEVTDGAPAAGGERLAR
jgi:hypothetical protein